MQVCDLFYFFFVTLNLLTFCTFVWTNTDICSFMVVAAEKEEEEEEAIILAIYTQYSIHEY